MNDSCDFPIVREPETECADAVHAERPARRLVGVVRVLRGRLAAPCRCCSEAAAEARLQDDARL
jgi:hypothetical protein